MTAFVSTAAEIGEVTAVMIGDHVALILRDSKGNQLGSVTLDSDEDLQVWQKACGEAQTLRERLASHRLRTV